MRVAIRLRFILLRKAFQMTARELTRLAHLSAGVLALPSHPGYDTIVRCRLLQYRLESRERRSPALTAKLRSEYWALRPEVKAIQTQRDEEVAKVVAGGWRGLMELGGRATGAALELAYRRAAARARKAEVA
jgi:hypothetical protein